MHHPGGSDLRSGQVEFLEICQAGKMCQAGIGELCIAEGKVFQAVEILQG